MDTLNRIAAKVPQLSPQHQTYVLEFVEFLLSKYPDLEPKKSAEERAIERLRDIDDPNQWITTVEISDPIDEKALETWLRNNGYQEALSSPTA